MIFEQLKQNVQDSPSVVALKALVAAGRKMAHDTGMDVDQGALAVAMWLATGRKGNIKALMQARFDPDRGCSESSCVKMVYQYTGDHYSDIWSTEGNANFMGWRVGQNNGAPQGFLRDLFDVDVTNIAVFLREWNKPLVEMEVVRALLEDAGAEVPVGAIEQMLAQHDAIDLDRPPFHNQSYMRVMLGGVPSEFLRKAILAAEDCVRKEFMGQAIACNRLEWVRDLLDAGFPAKEALPMAANSPEAASLLAQCGADLAMGDGYGRSLLHLTDRVDVARFALEKGCALHAVDEFGKTALHYTFEERQNERPEMLEERRRLAIFLLEQGADMHYVPANAETDYLTPFQHAVKNCQITSLELLLARGPVDLGQRTLSGRTLMQLCSAHQGKKLLLRAAKTDHCVADALAGASEANHSGAATKRTGPTPL